MRFFAAVVIGFSLATVGLRADSVLLRAVQIDAQPDEGLRKLAAALNQDLKTVLESKGLQVTTQGAAEAAKPALRAIKECKNAECARAIYDKAGYTQILVPILQRNKGSENLLCYLYRVDGDRITDENLLILFINLPRDERRAAIASVMVQFFPDATGPVAEVKPAEPEKKPEERKPEPEIARKPEEAKDQTRRDQKEENPEQSPKPEREPERTGPSLIRIASNPIAEVFIDGTRVGTTPFEMPADGTLKTVRLTAKDHDDLVVPLRSMKSMEIMLTLRRIRDYAPPSRSDVSPLGALARSLVLPGWGQYASGNQLSSYLFGAGSALALSTALYSAKDMRQSRTKIVEQQRNFDLYVYAYGSGSTNLFLTQAGFASFASRDAFFENNLTNCSSRECSHYRQAKSIHRNALGAFAILYLWNAVDAFLSAPSFPRETKSLSLFASPVLAMSERGIERGIQFGATVRFQ